MARPRDSRPKPKPYMAGVRADRMLVDQLRMIAEVEDRTVNSVYVEAFERLVQERRDSDEFWTRVAYHRATGIDRLRRLGLRPDGADADDLSDDEDLARESARYLTDATESRDELAHTITELTD
jgi:hypothetical protein